MRAKTVSTVAVFAALTVALNLWSPKIPAPPPVTFLYYQIWEIPIVAAFLLYGPLMGIAIALMNTLVLLAYFWGASPTGPLYNLAAVLGMLLGIYSVHKFMVRHLNKQKETIINILSTTLGIISRVLTMSLVNWAFLRYPPPIGFSVPEELLNVWLPFIGLFNATLALYTIPLGYILARAVSSGIKIEMWNSRTRKD